MTNHAVPYFDRINSVDPSVSAVMFPNKSRPSHIDPGNYSTVLLPVQPNLIDTPDADNNNLSLELEP